MRTVFVYTSMTDEEHCIDVQKFMKEHGYSDIVHCKRDFMMWIGKNKHFEEIFSVSVVGFKADTFRENYSEYIKYEDEGWFDDRVFVLEAPQEIYDEIAGLKDDCIEILED